MSWDFSALRRLAGLAGAVTLLLFVGAVVTRGPAGRDVSSPNRQLHAPGLAGQTGAANLQLSGDPGIAGPYLTVAEPTSFNGDIRQLPPVKRVLKDVRPELKANENNPLASSHASVPDTAIQAPAGPSQPSDPMPPPLVNFPGLDFATAGTGYPPDTNGDVGRNHYIQVVNTGIGIFDKTGTLLANMTLDSFFQNAPPPCNTTNFGDPVALYDPGADRWIVTDFSWSNIDSGPHYECIAASKTGDPLAPNGWWFYALQTDSSGPALLNDYPKLGVWPDGIYMSANMFACSSNCSANTYEGARVWAISPTQLYNGSVLTTVLFTTNASVFSLLPSNYRGAAPPPGTPDYFVGNASNTQTNSFALDVFKFHADWTVPAHSTFTGPSVIPTTPYSGPPDTVPVLSGNALDSLGDRLMMQNQYRNLAGNESLWLAHTVDNPTGIRWYQLSVTGGTVSSSPTQQSTYAPSQGLNRWMPSLAVDKFGNMAVGYSTSNASQFPDIRYAGRLVGDALGTLGQSETTLIAGTGAQTIDCGSGPCIRWGDYSAMTVDPVDDCTFWYTTEYYSASGGDWQTRIGSFRYPVCGPVPPPLGKTYLPLLSFGSSGSWNTIMQEGFEGTWPSPGWVVSDPGFGEYFWAKRDCHASSGSFSAWAIGGGTVGQGLSCGTNYIDDTNSWMVYGPFSLADATAADFSAKLLVNSEPDYDKVCIGASLNNFSTPGGGICLSGDSSGVFLPETLDLSNVYSLGSLIGQPNVWIAVEFQSDNSFNYPDGAYVDDLLLRKCTGGACAAAAAAPSGARLTSHPARLIRTPATRAHP